MSFEHHDIFSQKRPERAYERTRAKFFYELVDRALMNFEEARGEKPEKAESPVRDIGFFFKKEWDQFVEPVLEYEDLWAEIMTKKWESKGAESRARIALTEGRQGAIMGLKLVLPDVEEMNPEERKKAVAKLYESYAAFIRDSEISLKRLTVDVHKRGGFDWELRAFLRTTDDTFLRGMVEYRIAKKERKKARKKESPEDPRRGIDT